MARFVDQLVATVGYAGRETALDVCIKRPDDDLLLSNDSSAFLHLQMGGYSL